MFKRAYILISLIATPGMLLTSCGYNDSDYQPYEGKEGQDSKDQASSSDGSTGTESSCETIAFQTFANNIAPAITASCANCHDAASHPLPLKKGDNSANRTRLLKWGALDTTKFFDLISDEKSHPGGDQSATLGLKSIEEWAAAESNCTK